MIMKKILFVLPILAMFFFASCEDDWTLPDVSDTTVTDPNDPPTNPIDTVGGIDPSTMPDSLTLEEMKELLDSWGGIPYDSERRSIFLGKKVDPHQLNLLIIEQYRKNILTFGGFCGTLDDVLWRLDTYDSILRDHGFFFEDLGLVDYSYRCCEFYEQLVLSHNGTLCTSNGQPLDTLVFEVPIEYDPSLKSNTNHTGLVSHYSIFRRPIEVICFRSGEYSKIIVSDYDVFRCTIGSYIENGKTYICFERSGLDYCGFDLDMMSELIRRTNFLAI